MSRAATRAHTVPRFYLRGFAAPESENCAKLDPFVWTGSLTTGEIERRSPKNISTEAGYYDGPGGFDSVNASIERHLSAIESDAAVAIAKFAGSPQNRRIADSGKTCCLRVTTLEAAGKSFASMVLLELGCGDEPGQARPTANQAARMRAR